MFEVHECTDETLCREYAARFGAQYAAGDRAFVFYEDGAKGMGVLGLEKGTVILKSVTNCGSDEYREVMLRALLAVARDFSPIPVVCRGIHGELERFGFRQCAGDMRVMSSEITLCCH